MKLEIPKPWFHSDDSCMYLHGAIVQTGLITHLSRPAHVVMLVIAATCKPDLKVLPPREELCRFSGLSPRAVERAVMELREYGLIPDETTLRRRKAGAFATMTGNGRRARRSGKRSKPREHDGGK